ncbi:hypothetical protein LCGC14_2416570, partial [marine sediment metagenome]
KGDLIPPAYHARKRIRAGEKDLAERMALRDRSAGPVVLPVAALRKGVNVLAVEAHRSNYHPEAVKWKLGRGNKGVWFPLAVNDIQLKATGGGVAPNLVRPKGVQVWNVDIHDRMGWSDFADPGATLGAIRIVAARNGRYSGAVAVASAGGLKNLRGTMGDLSGPGGAKIPSSGVKVRYLVPSRIGQFRSNYDTWAIDGLVSKAPSETLVSAGPRVRKRTNAPLPVKPVDGAVAPVWVTVSVPADAPAGEYKGTLTIAAEEAPPVEVPVELSVIGWRAPSPQQFRTRVTLYQSPTSVAREYGTPEWSEKHWRLIERSFAMLGEVGCDLVNIDLVDRKGLGRLEDEGIGEASRRRSKRPRH